LSALEDPTLLDESAEELYEHAPAGYLSTLPGGLVVKVNETLLAWTGHSRDDLVGRKRLHDLLAPGARIYYETHYAPLLQMQGSVREIAVELIRADGSRVPVLLNSTLVRDEAGVPRVVRTTVFNASDRRRYERELLRARADAESRARAALALAHVNEGVVLVGANQRIDVLNAAAERILGLIAADVVGRPVADVIPEWEGLVGLVPVGDPGEVISPAVLPLERSGHEQWLAAAGVDSGDGVVYTLRDVTADHTLEQLRGDVVAIVSHELRTPLTGVYGSAQTLLARYDTLNDDTRRQLLAMIVDQSDRLTRIVDQILLTSRLDTEDIVLATVPFEAAAVVGDLHAALPQAERERVVLDRVAGARVRGDAGITAQILTNLLDNALKYSSGSVHVGISAGDRVIRFTVADDGSGVPVGERERIFEKFYRLDPSHQLGVGGTGLGLYIAKQLTERMSGRIAVLPCERGTTVLLELPAAE